MLVDLAGGQVSLEDRDAEDVAKEIEMRFLELMGEKGEGSLLIG